MPMEEISELAYDHYKYVRYATVYMTRYRGGFHVANVRVEKLPGTYKVVKSPAPTTTTGSKTMPKLVTPQNVGKPSSIRNSGE